MTLLRLQARSSRAALAAGLALAFSSTSLAQFCDTELIPNPADFQAQGGAAVSIAGDICAFGSPFAVGGSATGSAGSVSVFELDSAGSWNHAATLTSPSPEDQGQFGYDVSVDGSTLVVGAAFEDAGGVTDSGAVYVYRRSSAGWVLTETVTELSQSAGARFGHSVDIAGTQVVVSAIRSDVFGLDAGAAYFYRTSTSGLIFEDRVGPNPATSGAFFGTSVSVSNGFAAVGAVFDSAIAVQEGSAYVFERQGNGTWNEYVKLTPPSSEASAFYGIAVDIRGSFLVVGAEGIDNGAADSGSAFVYRRDGAGTYLLENELQSPTPTDTGIFGLAVTYSNSRVAVTERGTESVHLYVRSGTASSPWVFERTITAINPGVGGEAFGTDASLRGDRLIVGDPLRTTSIPFSGGAFVYDLEFDDCNFNGLNDFCEVSSDPSLDCNGNGLLDFCELTLDPSLDCDGNGRIDSCDLALDPLLDCDGNGVIDTCELSPSVDCNGNNILDSCELASGTLDDLNMNGVPDTCEMIGVPQGCQTVPNSTGLRGELIGIGSADVLANDILLIGGNMPMASFGYPVVSRTPTQNLPPGAAGFRCVGGSIGRDFGNIFNTGATGTAMLPIDLSAIPQPGGTVQAVAGETWYWQLWHRDAFQGIMTSTFTDSLAITFL